MFHAFAMLYVPLLVSIGGLVAGAATGNKVLAAAAAGLGAVFLALSALVLNARLADAASGAPAGERDVARSHALLLAVGWAWGGAAMLAVYLFSGLKWQHGWQYGSGMVLIAGLIALYASRLARPDNALASPAALRGARIANAAQGIAAAVGVAWLSLSGKLATEKGDWAANDIFVAGALAIVALSALGLRARRH